MRHPASPLPIHLLYWACLAVHAPVTLAADAYVGLGGLIGISRSDDPTRHPVQSTPLSLSTDSGGFSGGLGAWAGYDFSAALGLPLRVEATVTLRNRHDHNLLFTQAGGSELHGAKGNVRTTDYLLSLLWEIPWRGAAQPYLGAGVGEAQLDIDTIAYVPHPLPTHARVRNGVWQLQAGFTLPRTRDRRLRVDYRYIDLGRFGLGPLPSGERFESRLTSHDFRIGYEWLL